MNEHFEQCSELSHVPISQDPRKLSINSATIREARVLKALQRNISPEFQSWIFSPIHFYQNVLRTFQAWNVWGQTHSFSPLICPLSSFSLFFQERHHYSSRHVDSKPWSQTQSHVSFVFNIQYLSSIYFSRLFIPFQSHAAIHIGISFTFMAWLLQQSLPFPFLLSIYYQYQMNLL